MKRSPINRRRKHPRPGRMTPAELEQLRKDCHERDLGACQECFRQTFPSLPHTSDNSYHMAHIQAKRMGGDSLANVRTLCGDCHRKEHNFGPSMTKPVPAKTQAEHITGEAQ